MLNWLAFGILLALPPAHTTKDEFVFNNRAEVESIDPQFLTGVPDNLIASQLFEGLMARSQDWVTLTPGLAESYKLSKDGKTYTFKLRPNLKWSDGTPITSQDFVYTFLRAMDPKTLAQYAYWLTDTVVGGAEFNKNPTPANAKKVGVSAPDEHTFVVKLVKPIPYFIQICAESLTNVVKKAEIEKYGDKWTRPEHLVTSGPYKLVDWKIQDRMVLEKNPYYYGAADVKLKRLVALPIEDRQTAVNMFLQGSLDWSGQQGAPNGLVPSFKARPSFRVFPSFTNYFYRLNTKRPPLNDKRVRQALTLAIDRQQLVEKVTRGGEIATNHMVPDGTKDFKSLSNLITSNYEANVKKARELLAAAGFPGGKGFPQLVLQYNTDENHKKVALAVVEMWRKQLGITIVPQNVEWKVYLKNQTAMAYDISRSAWSGDYPDPSTFLELFLSDSGNNQTGFKNAKYDELFHRANQTLDSKKRGEILAEAEQLLVEEAPVVPIYIWTNFGFLRPEVVGFKENLIDKPYFKFISKK